MRIVYESKQNMAFTTDIHAPFLLFGIEIEPYRTAVIAAVDVISLSVAFNVVVSVVSLIYLFAFSHGVAAAPELDAVQHHQIGKACDFVDGKHPKSEEHQFVEELVADILVPA